MCNKKYYNNMINMVENLVIQNIIEKAINRPRIFRQSGERVVENE